MKNNPSNTKTGFLLGSSDAALVPLLSTNLLSLLFNALWIIALFMFIFWPQKSYYLYFREKDAPINFLVVYLSILLVVSFISLRSGKGEFINQDFSERMTRSETTTDDESHGFLSFGLIRAIFQTFCFCLPFIPVLITSAALSEISMTMLWRSFVVLYTSALLCRLMGFLIYLIFGKWNQFGTLISWGVYVTFFVGTGYFAPFANPILLIYHYFRGTKGFFIPEDQTQSLYLIAIASAILVLTLLCSVKIGRGPIRELS